MTKEEITNKVKKSVESVDPKAKVILFGSRARGDFNSKSDWDFLILTSVKSDESLKRRIREVLIDAELEAEEVISSLIYSQQTWRNYQSTPLYKNINTDGYIV